MKTHTLATAIAVSLLSQTPLPALAAEAMETTLITATRTKQSIDDTLAPVMVFTREDIERLQAKNIKQLLAQVPGIITSQDGPKGSSTSIFLRGTNSDHTLFLIDGQRFSSATLGDTAIQFLDPEQIERIEIVKGPRSSLYGSEAIGGVIQIFTKKGSDNSSAYVRSGAGSNDSWQVATGARGSHNNTHYSVNVSYYDTDGFDAFHDITPPNNDDDGYNNTSASINVGHQFANNSLLNFNFLYSDSEEDHDSVFGASRPYSDHLVQTANLAYSSYVMQDVWFTTVTLGHSIDESNQRDRDTSSTKSDFETTRKSILWQNDFTISDTQLLTLGVEYYDDEIDSTTSYTNRDGTPVTDRDNTAFFGLYQFNQGPVDLQLGLRDDDNEDFGKKATANIAAGYSLDQQHKIIISYGEGFKAPTFNDLYWPISAYSYGNPDLVPENSENYEIEFRGNYNTLNWSASFYRNDIDNLIDWAPDVGLAWTPSNIASVRIKGVELATSATIAEWRLSGSLNYNEPENKETGKILTKRPKKSAIFNLDRNIGDVDFGFSWRAYSERFSDDDNTQKTAGFGLIDVRAAYQVSNNLKAQLKLNNLFDKEYQTNKGYNQDGFNWFVTLTYTM